MTTVNGYCERLDSTFWGEPANFLSNGGFLLGAYLAFRQARRMDVLGSFPIRWLLCWLTAIGIGSGLFHSLATPWAKICDVAPISVFVLSFLGFWIRQVLGWSWPKVVATYTTLVFVSAAFMALCRDPVFGGSQGYFGVLVLIFYFGWDQRRRFDKRPWLLYAAWAFGLALLFRTVDRPLCPILPLGTHWLWHFLNAFVCYGALRAMLEAPHMVDSRPARAI